jgi:hypothetical protein
MLSTCHQEPQPSGPLRLLREWFAKTQIIMWLKLMTALNGLLLESKPRHILLITLLLQEVEAVDIIKTLEVEAVGVS